MTKITVRYSSIDRFRQTRTFKTLKGARRYAVERVGEHPEFGSHYAVSSDGIGKVEVEGCTLQTLFAGAQYARCAYEVHIGCVNEDRGTISFYLDRAYATLAEAVARAQELNEEGVDDLRLVGTTDEAAHAIVAHVEAQRAAYEAQCFMDNERSPF